MSIEMKTNVILFAEKDHLDKKTWKILTCSVYDAPDGKRCVSNLATVIFALQCSQDEAAKIVQKIAKAVGGTAASYDPRE